jgi:hypothetical protein
MVATSSGAIRAEMGTSRVAAAILVLLTAACGNSQTVTAVKPTVTIGTDRASGVPPSPEVPRPTAAPIALTVDAPPTAAAAEEAPEEAEAPGEPIARVRVTGTGSDGLNLRSDLSSAAERVRTLPDGHELEVIGEDREVDGRTWRNVRDPSDGVTGWVAGEFVSPVSGE